MTARARCDTPKRIAGNGIAQQGWGGARYLVAAAASMVEEPKVREGHRHAVAVASRDDLLVGHGAARLRDVLHAQLRCVVDGVAEGEEGVGGDRDAVQAGQEGRLLLGGERLRHDVEVLRPLLVLGLVHVAFDVPHAGVHAVLPLHALLELQARDPRVEAEAPCRHLPARELHAIHAALLAGADADHHAILRVADGVGLRVLDGDHARDHVELGLLGQVLLLRHDLLQALGIADLVVALLHETQTAAHAVLHVGRLEVAVRLQDDELPTLLRLQHLEGLGLEARRDDAVADLDLQNVRRCDVDVVGNSDEVSERAHRVSVPGTDVSVGHGGQGLALDLVDANLGFGQGHTNGRTGGAHVLEGGGSGLPRSLRELKHELPCVHRVEQIDVAGRTRNHLERQLAAVHGAQARRQLMRVAAVLQRALHLESHRLGARRLSDLRSHPLADRGVVGRGQRKSGRRQVPPEGHAGAPVVCLHLLHDFRVLRGAGEDGHVRAVLRRGADHGGAADVDVLDAVGEVVGLGSDGLAEGVEVDDDEVDWTDTMRLHVGLMLGVATRGQEAAVHLRVQGLHTAVEDLWRAGVVGHILDCAAILSKLRGRAARRKHMHLVRRQELTELLQARLVEDRH
mmetsp:Transcript_17220/g.48967  ORF Transcript_17220/g.48967 Transcript_17220/m.48967 type:complete len:626 (-) Transcript_17220:150-2027(-)